MAVASSWLKHARFEAGLLIPGEPARAAADLLLRADVVEVRHRDQRVELAWGDLSGDAWQEPWGGSVQPGDRWSIGRWSFGQSGEIGVGLAVSGRYVAATERVRRSSRSIWNTLDQGLERHLTIVPLHPRRSISPTVDGDRLLVALLVSLLASSPEIRPMLTDPGVVERLAHGICTVADRPMPYKDGMSRTDYEIRAAIRAAHLQHRWFGRPLPNEDLVPASEAVSAVLERLRLNPFCRDLDVDPSRVEELVHEQYLDVEPWPFEALLG